MLALVEAAPDFEAFGLGLELIVFAALFAIGATLVLNWIVKTMRGSL